MHLHVCTYILFLYIGGVKCTVYDVVFNPQNFKECDKVRMCVCACARVCVCARMHPHIRTCKFKCTFIYSRHTYVCTYVLINFMASVLHK